MITRAQGHKSKRAQGHKSKRVIVTCALMTYALLAYVGLIQSAVAAEQSARMPSGGRDTAGPQTQNRTLADPAGSEIMVNNVWVDIPLTQIFRDISVETGAVITLCPHVPDPFVTFDADSGKSLQECLKELVAGRGLFIHQRNKQAYIIGDASPTCPSFPEMADSKRLYLNYITAKHLVSSLPRTFQQYVSSGERPNEVLVYTVPEIMERIMQIAAKLDVPRPQVVLEVLVVELWEQAGKEFGLDWQYSNRHNALSMTDGLGAFTGIARYTSVPKNELTELLFTLRALIREEKASIRSRPRIATLNGQKASIDISLDEYFTIVTDLYGSTARLRTELEVIKSGVTLEMTPHIGANGDITVDIITEVSDVASRQNQIEGNLSGDLPVIRRRRIDTCVRVKQGDAIVIGGLIETQQRSDDKRVPILSSIPFLGGAFKSKKSTIIKKEVVIFIIPHLITEEQNLPPADHNMISIRQELERLREMVTMIDVLDPNSYPDTSPRLDIDNEPATPALLTGRYDLLSMTAVLENMRAAVALLEMQNQYISNPPDDVNKERKSFNKKTQMTR